MNDDRSPETYVGYDRADNFASPGWIVENEGHVYASASLQLKIEWGLSGDKKVTGENAVPQWSGWQHCVSVSHVGICASKLILPRLFLSFEG